MDSDTMDNAGNALMSFTQQVGVRDNIITENHQNVSGSGTKWDQIFCNKDICHMRSEP